MKKLFFIFFTLITFANVSYASFPVSDTLKVKQNTVETETVEQYHIRMQKMGFDINDCRCDDCKKFKGINNIQKNGKTVQKKKTNYKSLFVTLGVWLFAAVIMLLIMIIVVIFNAFKGLSSSLHG
jgi:Flp pilus assembly protein TadB